MNDGGPAFPTGIDEEREVVFMPPGQPLEPMTLRDWFAGKALCNTRVALNESSARELAKVCYMIADAMIKEREKK